MHLNGKISEKLIFLKTVKALVIIQISEKLIFLKTVKALVIILT